MARPVCAFQTVAGWSGGGPFGLCRPGRLIAIPIRSREVLLPFDKYAIALKAVQGPDIEVDEAARMYAWHQETRYFRFVEKWRSRIIARYLTDESTLRGIASPLPVLFGETPAVLPTAEVGLPEIEALFSGRVSVPRRQLVGWPADLQIGQLLTRAVWPNRLVSSPVADVNLSLRPYPFAGGLYPCDVYVIGGAPVDRPMRYDAEDHSLVDFGAETGNLGRVEIGPSKNQHPARLS